MLDRSELSTLFEVLRRERIDVDCGPHIRIAPHPLPAGLMVSITPTAFLFVFPRKRVGFKAWWLGLRTKHSLNVCIGIQIASGQGALAIRR